MLSRAEKCTQRVGCRCEHGFLEGIASLQGRQAAFSLPFSARRRPGAAWRHALGGGACWASPGACPVVADQVCLGIGFALRSWWNAGERLSKESDSEGRPACRTLPGWVFRRQVARASLGHRPGIFLPDAAPKGPVGRCGGLFSLGLAILGPWALGKKRSQVDMRPSGPT